MTNLNSAEPSPRVDIDGIDDKNKLAGVSEHSMGQSDVIRVMLLLLTSVAVSCFLIYKSADNSFQMVLPPRKTHLYPAGNANGSSLEMVSPRKVNLLHTHDFYHDIIGDIVDERRPVSELERVLMKAAMEDKTVIITALNQAWAAPNSTFDVFRESFRIGGGTERLLKHVIAICVDSKAFARCLAVHPHCYFINTTDSDNLSGPNRFMTPGYLKIIWRRMEVLREVLYLGYSFVFTDADIMWLRDPFPRFFPDGDFQITCDGYNGIPSDKNNWVNSGFTYVKANNKTAKFYDFWCNASRRFPGRHDQDVFNLIKNDPFVAKNGIKMRFLDTVYFGGFCQPSRDINVVTTMHANCCVGLYNKVKYLRVVLDVWRKYLSENMTATETKWNVPNKCR